MIVLYVDDCIIISQSKVETKNIFKDLTNTGFKMRNEGTMVYHFEYRNLT